VIHPAELRQELVGNTEGTIFVVHELEQDVSPDFLMLFLSDFKNMVKNGPVFQKAIREVFRYLEKFGFNCNKKLRDRPA